MIKLNLSNFDSSIIKNMLHNDQVNILFISYPYFYIFYENDIPSFLNIIFPNDDNKHDLADPMLSKIIICNSLCHCMIMLKNINDMSAVYNMIKNLNYISRDYSLNFSYIIFYKKQKTSIGLLVTSNDIKKIINFIESIIITDWMNILSFVKLDKNYLRKLIKMIIKDKDYYMTFYDISSLTSLLDSLIMLVKTEKRKRSNIMKETNKQSKKSTFKETNLEDISTQLSILEKFLEKRLDKITFLDFNNNMLVILQKNQIIKWYLTGMI